MAFLRDGIDAMIQRALLAISERFRVDGLEVRIVEASDDGTAIEREKVTAAIELLARYSPMQFKRIKRDLRCVHVYETAGNVGEFAQSVRTCILDTRYLREADTSPALVAATIVHEATHARIAARGFGYDPQWRARIERLCVEAEIAFGRRLPDGEAVIIQAREALAAGASLWSDEAHRRRAAQRLREAGFPAWLLRLLRVPAA